MFEFLSGQDPYRTWRKRNLEGLVEALEDEGWRRSDLDILAGEKKGPSLALLQSQEGRRRYLAKLRQIQKSLPHPYGIEAQKRWWREATEQSPDDVELRNQIYAWLVGRALHSSAIHRALGAFGRESERASMSMSWAPEPFDVHHKFRDLLFDPSGKLRQEYPPHPLDVLASINPTEEERCFQAND